MSCTSAKLFAVATLLVAAVTLAADATHAHKRSGVGGACGGMRGVQCKKKLFCDYAPAALCGAADAMGSCARKPQVCTLDYRPVCGCDDKTYPNDCARRASGVGKVKDGACKAG
jgi:hypothetical protein